MNTVLLAAMSDELQKIATEKDAGLGDSVKNFLLKDIGGPKGILEPAGRAVANVGKAVKAAPKMTRQVAGGAYDVSHMAQQMGI